MSKPTPDISVAERSANVSGDAARPSAPRLSLTDFLDVGTLQDIQDSFAAITRLTTRISDPNGETITAPTDTASRDESDELLAQLLDTEADDSGVFTAPILVEGQQLGSICIERSVTPAQNTRSGELQRLADKLKLSAGDRGDLIKAAEEAFAANRGASIQFLYLLANAIARMCYEQYHAEKRVEELSVLYKISTLLSGHRGVQQVLDAAAQSIAEAMKVKAASIRMVQGGIQGGELVPKAVYHLSDAYLEKGRLRIDESKLFQDVLQGNTAYIEDMAADARILYPEDAQREGLVSMLITGVVYQGRPIGTVQLFTDERRRFTHFETKLVEAISQLLATAIENAQLDAERQTNQEIVRQLKLAAAVQRRMLPASMPCVSGVDVAARYVPSMDLAGDFYDFIELDGSLALGIGDVVGKGVAASLLMASVRASLRAYAQDVYDLDEVIVRVNQALCRDTLDKEFVTLWYGTIDHKTLRMTYCNAGHEPGLLCRNGNVYNLDAGGMIVGVDPTQAYEKGIWDLEPGDMLLLYTDGLVDAFNYDEERFGRDRIEDALKASADKSASDALNHILWEMRRFTGLRRASDDTSVVVVKITERPEDYRDPKSFDASI